MLLPIVYPFPNRINDTPIIRSEPQKRINHPLEIHVAAPKLRHRINNWQQTAFLRASDVWKLQVLPFIHSFQMNLIIQLPNRSHCQKQLPPFETGIIKLIIIIQREVEGTFHRIQAPHHAWSWQQQQRRKPKVKIKWKKQSPHNILPVR